MKNSETKNSETVKIKNKIRDIVTEDKIEALIAMAEPDENGELRVLVIECE